MIRDMLADVNWVTTPHVMLGITAVMAIFWSTILEQSKSWFYDEYLPKVEWWPRAIRPTQQMMYNFGYPKEPTPQFPNAVTEPMARDFYALLSMICLTHFLSAVPMVPVVWYGWENVSNSYKSMFVLGTLSDVAFDVYDAIKSTYRAFHKNASQPLPVDFWIVVVAMHHTLALSLVLPMNHKYVYLVDYQQTVVSLLMAASICYAAGNYKFTLDIQKPNGFYQYKFIVLLQLGTILYTRVYLWYPALYNLLKYLKEEDDTVFFYGGCVMGVIFSIFNLLLVVDAFGAAVKWLPRTMPKSRRESELMSTEVADGAGMVPVAAMEFVAKYRRRQKFRAAAHSVMAMNRMKKLTSMNSSAEDTDSNKKDS